jgi:hypothetical protein
MSNSDHAARFIIFVHTKKERTQVRLGQALYNALPTWAGQVITGQLWDPFYKRDMSSHEVQEWVDNHLIFSSDGYIEAIFDEDTVLATAPIQEVGDEA